MLNTLIVDDEKQKISEINAVIMGMDVDAYVDKANDVEEAKVKIMDIQYDIMILDLYIPTKCGLKDEKPENARDFLNYIKAEDDVYKPYFVIGNSAFDDAEDYKDFFTNHLYYLLKYDETDDSWMDALKGKILYFNQLKKKIQTDSRYDYDVAFIIALPMEFDEVINASGSEWTKHDEYDPNTVYYTTTINNKKNRRLRVVAAYADQMGMSASTLLTAKMIYTFHPKYVIMTGICATTDDDIDLGDILVFDQSWNGGSGKLKDGKKKETLFLPDPHYETLDGKIKTIVNEYSRNRSFLDAIKADFKYKAGKPKTELNVHCADVTSVSAVTQSKVIVDLLKDKARKLAGLEMEGYGVYYAAKHSLDPAPTPIVIKAAADRADVHKSDNYQQYCAYVSARLAFHMIVNDLKF